MFRSISAQPDVFVGYYLDMSESSLQSDLLLRRALSFLARIYHAALG